MKVTSHLPTRVRYTVPVGATRFPEVHVEIAPGENNVPSDLGQKLLTNSLFQTHREGGFLDWSEEPAASPAAPEINPSVAATLEILKGMSPEERAATLPTLSDEERAAYEALKL